MALIQIQGAGLGSLGEGGGFLSTIADGVSKAGAWFSQNSGQAVQLLDAVGRLKAQSKAQTVGVDEAWTRNIVNTPPVSWFDQDSVFRGVKNGYVAVGALLGAGLLFMVLSKRPEVARG